MILDLLSHLTSIPLILASSSPRRKDLLLSVGLSPLVIPSTFAEDLDKATFSSPEGYCEETAYRKALEVVERLIVKHDGEVLSFPFILISADSVVSIDGAILEKPRDEAHATAMMQKLSGRTHTVSSGVCLVVVSAPASSSNSSSCVAAACNASSSTSELPSAPLPLAAGYKAISLKIGDCACKGYRFTNSTAVSIAEMPASFIKSYVKTADPYDKAGGYGVQSLGAQFVTGLEGDYYTAVGIPLQRICAVLRHLVLHDASSALFHPSTLTKDA